MSDRPFAPRLAFPVGRRLIACLFVVFLFCLAPGSLEKLAPAGLQLVGSAQATETVYSCGLAGAGGANNIFTAYSTFGIAYSNFCGDGAQYGLLLQQDGVNSENPGQVASWYTTTPAGLAITYAAVGQMQVGSKVGTAGYAAYFYWTGGSQPVTGANGAFAAGIPSATTFGFALQCTASGTTCPPEGGPYGASIQVDEIQLAVAEDPSSLSIIALDSKNLWYRGALGYVRGGGWSIAYSASAPSGILSMAASENGVGIGVPAPPGCNPNPTVWQQCPGTQTWSPTISLTGNGNQQLTMGATTPAGNAPAVTETIHVDSVPPTVTLTGPTSASASAGTQYVTATAAVGPSGLRSLSCSTDGGPAQLYKSSPAQIPVSGPGTHSIRCTATNRSFDSAGAPATSAPASFSMDIGTPTASGIWFGDVIHGLKCKKVRERVKIAAKWVVVHRHGKLVKVHRRARTKRVRVMKCRERFVRRKVTELAKVKRHGRTVLVKRTKVEKVPLPPQAINASTKRVPFGGGTAVSGVLTATDGSALAGRSVEVLTAPNNQLGQWTQAAAVTTDANGAWTAQLPPGPSRLVEASYAGDSTTLPSTSATVHLVVPAKVKIHISPRGTRWGGTIHIRGRVLGGFIPAGKLLRLRIGVAGVHETVGIPNVRPNGRFHTTWTFAAGRGVVHYWFSISTLSEADYPYAPASSRRVYVRVGPG